MTPAAERALAHVRARSAAGGPDGLFDRARITVNFHPDRLAGLFPAGLFPAGLFPASLFPAGPRPVAEWLARDGVYRSQFETGISNGRVGGDRDRWEHRMFGGAYDGAVTGRPIYGGLNLAGYPDGASPRFGSCYLELTAAASARATFSHGDSVTSPTVVGTADAFGAVWAALLDEVARTGKALNLAAGGPAEWVAALAAPRTAAGRAMDDYVEAQIHGGVDLRADVTAVVADPSFIGTPTAESLARMAPELRWHAGFVLAPGDFPASLRGPAAARLAAFVAEIYGVDRLDAATVGRAARSVVREPAAWVAFGAADDVLQEIKYLWHVLVLRGEAAK